MNNNFPNYQFKMKILIRLFLLIIFAQATIAHAAQSMRRCMLLPITDQVNGALGFKVFEEMEQYLKESDWCIYKHNSEILNILTNYKKNLEEHLRNKDVLKVLAEKTSAGSLVRINLTQEGKGIKIKTTVIGDNGEDTYFDETISTSSDDIVEISQIIKNWLKEYSKTIPYDGQLIGVLGDQFSVDIGKQFGLTEDAKVTIIRPIRKKRHPLLKEIVEWETEKIGEGKIFHSSKMQSQGRIVFYEGKKRLQLDDWLIINKGESKTYIEPATPEEDGQNSFGKLGIFGLFPEFGSGTLRVLDSTGVARKYSGTVYGASIRAEVWATREFWAGVDISKKFGSYKIKSGSASNSDLSTNNGYYKLKVGYKYLPMGFFFGPQVDGYLGYGRYTYGPDASQSDSVTESSFSGFLAGIRGSFPIKNTFRPYMELEFMAFSNYEEETTTFGDADSVTNFNLQLGCGFLYSPRINFDAAFVHTNSKAKFTGPEREVSYKDTSLKLGTTYTF